MSKELLRYAICDTIFQFMFSDIFTDVFDGFVQKTKKGRFILKITLTSEKSKKKIIWRFIFEIYNRQNSLSYTRKYNQKKVLVVEIKDMHEDDENEY